MTSPTVVPIAISQTPGLATAPPTREERAPGLGFGADGAEPVRTEPGDQRKVAEGLDVLNERRAPSHPFFERSRRHELRLRVAAVHPVHQRTLLACDVAARKVDDAHVDRVMVRGTALLDRVGHPLASRREASVDRDDNL